MNITLNITEDSKVELVRDNCEAVQGENNVTVLTLNWPQTIKGYSIDNYAKQIEFGECKELGECTKFLDVVTSNTYKLCDCCTAFKKILIQFTLKNLIDEDEPIVWKTVPFALEFCESVMAENAKEVQTTLLSLAEIKAEWEAFVKTTALEWQEYIKANTLRMIYRVGDVPTADAESLGDTIFYLGANSTTPYTLTYGRYYRCIEADGVYSWQEVSIDGNVISGTANFIKEINESRDMQLWVGTDEELQNEVIQPNTMYIAEDHDEKQSFDDILNAMAEDENYNVAYPILQGDKELVFKEKHIPLLDNKLQIDENGVLKFGDTIIPQKKLLSSTALVITDGSSKNIYAEEDASSVVDCLYGRTFEIHLRYGPVLTFTCYRDAISTDPYPILHDSIGYIGYFIRYADNGTGAALALSVSGRNFVVEKVYEIIE